MIEFVLFVTLFIGIGCILPILLHIIYGHIIYTKLEIGSKWAHNKSKDPWKADLERVIIIDKKAGYIRYKNLLSGEIHFTEFEGFTKYFKIKLR